jgi:gamma-glutamylcyclotransferase (GGCT)/AIG2-like uncharacterized protein YtfP
MNETQYIFVYGSLREGCTNYNKIHKNPNVIKIGHGITECKYSFIGTMSGAYPYASHYSFVGVDKVNIIGELYEVITPSYLQDLDKLEYNYTREIVSVIVDGTKYNTNMYVLLDAELIGGVKESLYPNGKKRFYNIETGDWCKQKITTTITNVVF